MRALLLLLVLIGLPALDELDKEVARHQVELAKLEADHAQAAAKARQKSITTLERLAVKQARAGDLTGATLVWKEVLRLDQEHLEARRYFSTLGTLDAMLAEVSVASDVLGNPAGGAIPRAGRNRLLLAGSATLTASGAALGAGFNASTVELLVGTLQGDGPLFREGGSANGQELTVAGNQVTFLVRTNSVDATVVATIDRTLAWNHIAGCYTDGQLTLWINGKPAASGKAPFTAIAGHSPRSMIGGLNTGGVAIAGFRLSRTVRYQAPFPPPTDLVIDAATVAGISSATLAPLVTQATVVNGQPPTIAGVPGAPDTTLAWTAGGSVGIQ